MEVAVKPKADTTEAAKMETRAKAIRAKHAQDNSEQ